MRIKRLMESIEAANLDAYIVSRESNIYYYTGSISGGFLLAVHGLEPTLLAPSMNLAIALDKAKGCRVEPYGSSNLLDQIEKALGKTNPRHVGFDDFTIDMSNRLQKRFPEMELRSSAEITWNMRRIKDPEEQGIMRRAGELTDIGMEAAKEYMKEGVKECEIAAEVVHAMMKNGAGDVAFSPIIASGQRSAYPHAGVTERKIRRGEFIVIDIGATYREYRSDLTRTFIVGEPSKKQIEIYETVLQANEEALPKIRNEAKGSDVDGVARAVIVEAGFREYFVHGLGHGVGLEIHEPPSLSEKSGDTLRVGNVITDEPGIYIPGWGGVRVEDTILVTSDGPEKLTRFDKSLDGMRV